MGTVSISPRAAGTIFTTVLTFMLTVVLAFSPEWRTRRTGVRRRRNPNLDLS